MSFLPNFELIIVAKLQKIQCWSQREFGRKQHKQSFVEYHFSTLLRVFIKKQLKYLKKEHLFLLLPQTFQNLSMLITLDRVFVQEA